MTRTISGLENYRNSYAYGELLKTHSLSDEGLWNIYGEDPNCDFGGHHHTPFLEQVDGKLGDVVVYATTLPRFFQWGSGGRIEAVVRKNVRKIGSQGEQLARLEEIDRLKKQIADLNEKLKSL